MSARTIKWIMLVSGALTTVCGLGISTIRSGSVAVDSVMVLLFLACLVTRRPATS